jgi:hypothetical protein
MAASLTRLDFSAARERKPRGLRPSDFDYVLVIPMHGSKEIGPGLLAKLLKQIDGTWG